jgi:hypothetical protein
LPAAAENSDTNELLMQTADHGMGQDAFDPLNWAR